MQNVTFVVLFVSTALVLLGSLDFQDAEAASKVIICHNGDTKEFPEAAVASHLAHGDTEGACPDEIVSTSKGSNGFGAINSNSQSSHVLGANNFNQLPTVAIGGEFIGIDTVSVLVAGTQNTTAWMIPVIISVIGIAIVIARKF